MAFPGFSEILYRFTTTPTVTRTTLDYPWSPSECNISYFKFYGSILGVHIGGQHWDVELLSLSTLKVLIFVSTNLPCVECEGLGTNLICNLKDCCLSTFKLLLSYHPGEDVTCRRRGI